MGTKVEKPLLFSTSNVISDTISTTVLKFVMVSFLSYI